MKNQDTCSGNGILANARLWGVQIVHVDEMLSYAQQLLRAISGARKRSQKTEAKCLAPGSKVRKAGKLKPPFLKVEDQSRQFRPFHYQFKSFPNLNFLAPKSSSPFEPLKSLLNSCRARDMEGCPMLSEGEKSPQSTPVTVPKKKRGFCECCQETFEELQKHLQSPQHKRFALDDSQYAPVDHVISQLTNNFVEQSAKVPQSCLTDEHLMPQAQVTRGNEMLTAELRKESQQAPVELFIDAEADPGLKMKECSTHLPSNRVSNLGEGKGLSENCSLGWPAGAGLARGVCAVQGTTEGSIVVGDTDSGVAPSLSQETHVETAQVRTAVASSFEPHKQQMLGPVSHLLQALPVSRKRQLSSRQSAQVGKKPRLELAGALSQYEQTSPVDGGTGVQDAGRISELDLPWVAQAGSLPLSTELCTRPRSSPALELCLSGDPATQPASLEAVSVGFDPTEMAAASTISQYGWSRVNASSHGKQLREEDESTPLPVDGHDLGCRTSTVSKTSCPAGQLPSQKLPVAEARCCRSLCVRAAEKVAPELPDLPGHSKELTPGPGLPLPLSHNTQADLDFRTASESDWDIGLLSMLTGVQGSRILPVDRHLLRRTCVSVRDSGYESQLRSVLKRESELDWAGKDDKNCRNCCTETEGASFPISETSLGSWTS